MNQSQDDVYHIVAAVDLTELSERALEQAIALASHYPAAKLHVVTVASTRNDKVVLPGRTEPTTHAAEDVREYLLAQISKYSEDHGELSLSGVAVYVAIGDPAERIVSLAEAASADVIVMGTHGRHGVKRLLEGSVAEKVVRNAKCGVFVVHAETRRPPDRSAPIPPAEVDVLYDDRSKA